ncbi:hypothetical protein CEXT_208071 [Caerostris extrusa]|uniref:Uncharacterized protein n=1 Tax=Caerostris extrusa TaxID=172846 RepID=A0AAV4W4X3_CAEEX|nr:hypothetical protein CEXT_208071 [Caerostris extrusa]
MKTSLKIKTFLYQHPLPENEKRSTQACDEEGRVHVKLFSYENFAQNQDQHPLPDNVKRSIQACDEEEHDLICVLTSDHSEVGITIL